MTMLTSHRVISTSIVVPAENPEEVLPTGRRIELTPCDLQLLFIDQIQKGLLFRRPKQDSGDNLVDHLKDSLSRALAIFYPLAGRLSSVDNRDGTSSFFLNCNHAGAAFIHAVADGVSVDDVVSPVIIPDGIVYPLFAMNGALNCGGVSNPLLAVQVTELADGLFVALSVNHCVFDGTSFWLFFNTWARFSRDHKNDTGVYSVQLPPMIAGHNYLEGVVDLPIRLPNSTISDAKNATNDAPPPELQQRMFRFRREKISELKAKANAEMGTDRISSLQALMAHLWVSITRHRDASPEEEISYNVIVGLRTRLDPPLSDRHIGNAVVFESVKCTAGELLERGTRWAAWEMNRMIASKTVAGVRSFFRDWAQNPVLPTVVELRRNCLVTGSSPRFDVYGNDFGWGKPVAVRSGPGNKFDGKLTVFAGTEEGSVDFEACLSRETLEAMANDEEFMHTLATQ